MRALALLLPALALAACAPEPEDEDDDEGVTDTGPERPEESLDCEAIELDINGPAEPQVGDSWVVWMRCDDALMTGTMVLRFDPPDVAEVSDNNALFVAPGEATMRFQVGGRRVEQDVSIAP